MDDPSVSVYEVGGKGEEGVEVGDDVLGWEVLGPTCEPPQVEEEDADLLPAHRDLAGLRHERLDDRRRRVLPEQPRHLGARRLGQPALLLHAHPLDHLRRLRGDDAEQPRILLGEAPFRRAVVVRKDPDEVARRSNRLSTTTRPAS